jgi:hypothetical protein
VTDTEFTFPNVASWLFVRERPSWALLKGLKERNSKSPRLFFYVAPIPRYQSFNGTFYIFFLEVHRRHAGAKEILKLMFISLFHF